MARRKNTDPENVTADRMTWIRAQMATLGGDIAKARKAGSWQALSALRRELRALRDQLDAGVAAADERKRKAGRSADPADMSPDERATLNAADAAACDDCDLELYVGEWCRRNHLRLDVVGGEPRLSREDTLRLVRG